MPVERTELPALSELLNTCSLMLAGKDVSLRPRLEVRSGDECVEISY